jgi:protein FAM50
MDKFHPDASDRPHGGTSANTRFTSQAATAEDRKRRAEALDLKEREATSGVTPGVDSGASTPAEE